MLKRAPLTLEEVADFLELEPSPKSQRWAACALAYTTAFDSPLARMAGLMLAHAWLAVIHPPFSPAGRPASAPRRD